MGPQSWWGVLLGGLAGAVLGGTVTFAALWWTIRHDRRMRREDRLVDAIAIDCITIASAINLVPAKASNTEVHQMYLRVVGDTSLVMYLARAASPKLGVVLRDALASAAEMDLDWAGQQEVSSSDLLTWYVALELVLTEWLRETARVGQFGDALNSARRVVTNVTETDRM